MAADPSVIEQAVSRTLRDSLERIQRASEELHQAVNDLVSACASSRPTNTLPAMVRAQTSAASLSAILEVLSRFVAVALRPPMESPSAPLAQPAELSQAPAEPQWREPIPPAPISEETISEETMGEETRIPAADASSSTETSATDVISETVVPQRLVPEPVAPETLEPKLFVPEPLVPQPMGSDLPLEEPSVGGELVNEDSLSPAMAPLPVEEPPAEEVQESLPPVTHAPVSSEPLFDVSLLSSDLQELHRRAYRVAKVSMQDIKMLRPEDVRIGREKKDLCFRLRDDIEKAHKEYQRRFQPILSHPVDYFYDWMVQILADGDPEALGEYPYSSTVLHR